MSIVTQDTDERRYSQEVDVHCSQEFTSVPWEIRTKFHYYLTELRWEILRSRRKSLLVVGQSIRNINDQWVWRVYSFYGVYTHVVEVVHNTGLSGSHLEEDDLPRSILHYAVASWFNGLGISCRRGVGLGSLYFRQGVGNSDDFTKKELYLDRSHPRHRLSLRYRRLTRADRDV